MVVVLDSHRLPPSVPLSPACETEPVCRLITAAQPRPPPIPHPLCVAAGAGAGKPTGSPSSLLSAVLPQPGFLFHSALEGSCSSPPELGP